MTRFLFATVLSLGASGALAAENTGTKSWECKRGKETSTRKIDVRYLSETKKVPCEVVYDNGTGPKTAWNAKSEQGYCEKNAEALYEKLKADGWQCNEAGATQATEHSENVAPKHAATPAAQTTTPTASSPHDETPTANEPASATVPTAPTDEPPQNPENHN